jgi:hypothetical protein
MWHLCGDNGVRQTEILTPHPSVPRSSALEVYMALEKQKDTSPFTDPTPANQIKVESRTEVPRSIN